MVSLLSLVSQICLFCFLNYSSKLRRENKEIRSGGLWFSYKYIAVSKHTRNERIAAVKTFEILDFYEAPPSHSNGFYILGDSFSFHSYFFFIVN